MKKTFLCFCFFFKLKKKEKFLKIKSTIILNIYVDNNFQLKN